MKRQNVRKLLQMISLLIFPLTIYYFSPVLILQGAAQGIIAASAITFGLQFLLAIIFGRAFCSYLCPAGALQDIACEVNDKPAKLGKRVYIKSVIWIIWIVTITVSYILQREKLHVDVSFMMSNGMSIAQQQDFIIYYFIVAILVLPGLFLGKRATCHYLCWMAPFMQLGTKLRRALHLPGLRLEAHKENCVGCNQCTKHCPMSLDVKDMVQKGTMYHSECILCGRCVDSCSKQALKYTFHVEEKMKDVERE